MRILILLTISALSLAANKFSYEGYKVFRTDPTGDKQLDALLHLRHNQYVDFWSSLRRIEGHVDIMVHPNGMADFVNYLEKYGIKYEVLIPNVARLVEEEEKQQKLAPKATRGKVSFLQYHLNSEINDYLDQLAIDHPDTVIVETIGKSYEQRDLKMIKIKKDVLNETTKPIIFIDAAIHAREWLAPAVALYAIQQLVENPRNSHMLDDMDWHILPVVNPDGYYHSHMYQRFWRKTRSPGNQLCSGTDGNRNFDFHWAEIGSSANPCFDDYHGTEAFSESETAAIRDYVNGNKENIKLYLTFHSYGSLILYPWGYTEDLPENSAELQELGERAAAAIRQVAGTSYIVGSSTNVLYAAAGGSDDWVKGVGGVELAYTIELPSGGWVGFDPPPTQILPVVKETWEGIKVYHQYFSGGFVDEEENSGTTPDSSIIHTVSIVALVLLQVFLVYV